METDNITYNKMTIQKEHQKLQDDNSLLMKIIQGACCESELIVILQLNVVLGRGLPLFWFIIKVKPYLHLIYALTSSTSCFMKYEHLDQDTILPKKSNWFDQDQAYRSNSTLEDSRVHKFQGQISYFISLISLRKILMLIVVKN